VSVAPGHGTGSATIADIVGLAAGRYGEATAAIFKRDGDWTELSYRELAEIVSEIGRGLIDLGLQPGDRVGLLCTTRVDWSLVDYGITSAGAVVVPIYPTNSPEECAWVLGDSESRFVVVEDAGQAAKIVAVRDRLPALRTIVVVDPAGAPALAAALARLAARLAQAEPEQREAAQRLLEALEAFLAAGGSVPLDDSL
jgi:long-chain acyl-CoA synthetase